MVSAKLLFFAAVAAVVSASPTCHQPKTPILPKTGGSTELPPPPANLVLKKIAIGHGIQNYTCTSTTLEKPAANGAVAVLYDVTTLYPGSGRTALHQNLWDNLPSKVLWNSPLPFNKLAGTKYGADPNKPFPKPENLNMGHGVPTLKFLGHHFFDKDGIPVFDLSAAKLKATVGKTGEVAAPANADKGVLGTGAVAWLQLRDSNKGLSQGLDTVYRVITAGGAAKPCSAGAGVQSVPYTTYYWFYG